MKLSECYKIAHVAKAHGLKGEVTLTLMPECPDWDSIEHLFIDQGGQLVPYFVQNVSVKGDKAYLKLEEVTSIDEAERLRGKSLYLPKESRPRLERGSFYPDEVVGFLVLDKNAGALGTVAGSLEQGPLLYLRIVGGKREVLLPLNGPFITKLVKKTKTIHVDLPDGYLDL